MNKDRNKNNSANSSFPSPKTATNKISKNKFKINKIKRTLKKENGKIITTRLIGNNIINKNKILKLMSINLRKGFNVKAKQLNNEIIRN